MALDKIIKNINVDFYDDKYILINAKQYDGKSRYINVTCYNQGKIFNLSPTKHSVYVKYKKPDEHTVFNFCTITPIGQIEVELTEQMLAVSGMCDVDLVVVNKGSAVVNIDTGEITTVVNAEELGTMTFRIYVYESSVDNSVIESSDEYSGLTKLLADANAEYERVIKASQHWSTMSQSYAMGGTDIEGRVGVEDADNSKYYSQLSKSYAIGDTDVREMEDIDNSKYYSEQAAISVNFAATSASEAKNSAEEAKDSASEAAYSAELANNSVSEASICVEQSSNHANQAGISANLAKTSASEAKNSAEAANNSASEASDYKERVESINNTIMNSINTLASSGNVGSFIYIGAITFEELIELSNDEKAFGYVYSIINDFVTDDTFVCGSGVQYSVGTNVYYTSDGWDCLGGTSLPTATVDEIKEYLGI